MRPFAGLSFGGTSPAPLNVAWIGIWTAKACEPVTKNAAAARAPRLGLQLPVVQTLPEAIAQPGPASMFFTSPAAPPAGERLRLGRRPISSTCFPPTPQVSKREPRIEEYGVVAPGVMRAAKKRAVEIVRAAVEMQIFGELDADL